MPPRKRIEATVFIVDCSSNVEERLKLLNKIHAMALFTQTKGAMRDLQKIILYNHPGLKSKHVVNEWGYYSFKILKSIKTQIETSDQDYRPHNFLYILNGALEEFSNKQILNEYIKRIVFITDLSSTMDYDKNTDAKVNFIKEEMLQLHAWLYVVGINVKIPRLFKQEDISKLNKIIPAGDLTPEKKNNIAVMSKFDKNIVYVNNENGLDVFFAHKIQPKLPYNWYVNMNIGPDLEVPVVVFRTTRPPELIKFYPCPKVPGVGVAPHKCWYDVNTHNKVEHLDVVKGHKHQGKFAVIPDEKLINSRKIATHKCLTIFAFADADEVPLNLYLMPDSVSCIKQDPRGPQSASDRRFALFVTSLRVKNSVALAYRVYNNGNSRKLYCIFPCPEHKKDGHLLMGQLPYQHEFHEGFVRGKIDEAPYTSKTYNQMTDFLDTLSSFDEASGKELYPFAPSMEVSRSRARKAEFLVSKTLDEKPEDPPQLTMHPVLEEKAVKQIEALREVLLN